LQPEDTSDNRTPDQFDEEPGLDQHYQVLKELGDCYAAVSDFARARRCYEGACELAPDQAEPYVGLGVIGIQTEDLAEARAAFEIARKLDPGSAEAYGGLAMVNQKKGDHQAAFEMYLKCLELDTDNLVALLGLFQISCQRGTFDRITHYLEVYLDKHPGDAAVLFCLASLYAREGKLAEAQAALRTVLDLDPDNTEAETLLSDVTKSLACVHQPVR